MSRKAQILGALGDMKRELRSQMLDRDPIAEGGTVPASGNAPIEADTDVAEMPRSSDFDLVVRIGGKRVK